MEGELQSVKDNATHQKKRLTDMMMTLLKDLGEIGTAVATQHSELMVRKEHLFYPSDAVVLITAQQVKFGLILQNFKV